MGTGRLPAEAERSRTQAFARLLGLRPGEVTELLERLPFGVHEGPATPEAWERPLARRALAAYAARKRAVARLAGRDRL
jgi:hypothetical protein